MVLLEEGQDKTFLFVYWALFSLTWFPNCNVLLVFQWWQHKGNLNQSDRHGGGLVDSAPPNLNETIQISGEFIKLLSRPVTSLGHEAGRRLFWEGPKFFKLCPTVLNYVQHIFPGGAKKIFGGFRPPGYEPAFKWRLYPTFRRSTPPAQV